MISRAPLSSGPTTSSSTTPDNRFELQYSVAGNQGVINYIVHDDGAVDFTFQEPSGKTRTASYRSDMGKPFLPQSAEWTSSLNIGDDAADAMPLLKVTSPAFGAGDELPGEFTGDGLGQSPPIAWTKGPPGTQAYAINLWHTPESGDVKSYWVLYDIPADITSLPQNVRGTGTPGTNDKGHLAYDPMRSKGPGVKQYHLTVFALSESLGPASTPLTRNELLERISGITLAQGTLNFQYTRNRTNTMQYFVGAILLVITAFALWRCARRFSQREQTHERASNSAQAN